MLDEKGEQRRSPRPTGTVVLRDTCRVKRLPTDCDVPQLTHIPLLRTTGPRGVQKDAQWRQRSRWTAEDEYRFPGEKQEKQSQEWESGPRYKTQRVNPVGLETSRGKERC